MKATISQSYTEAGVVGIILMVVGPIVAVIGLMMLSSPYSAHLSWPYWIVGIGSIVSLLSLPMIIAGRRYTITEVRDEQ